jgi:putative SOS response-associated peptidase YedK
MCGRYRLSRRKQFVEEYFESAGEEDWVPRYNIAPTQPVPIIRQNPKEPHRELSLVRWGLVPWWAKAASGAARESRFGLMTGVTSPFCSLTLSVRSRYFYHEEKYLESSD